MSEAIDTAAANEFDAKIDVLLESIVELIDCRIQQEVYMNSNFSSAVGGKICEELRAAIVGLFDQTK